MQKIAGNRLNGFPIQPMLLVTRLKPWVNNKDDAFEAKPVDNLDVNTFACG